MRRAFEVVVEEDIGAAKSGWEPAFPGVPHTSVCASAGYRVSIPSGCEGGGCRDARKTTLMLEDSRVSATDLPPGVLQLSCGAGFPTYHRMGLVHDVEKACWKACPTMGKISY